MKKNINLVEILKNAPKGTKLWSPIFGECSLVTVCSISVPYPITVTFNDETNYKTARSFTAFGKYTKMDGTECVLFPSKEYRDWSTFKAPWKHKHFEPFQKVLIVNKRAFEPVVWIASIYSHYKDGAHYTLSSIGLSDDEILPYEGNEDKLGKPVE